MFLWTAFRLGRPALLPFVLGLPLVGFSLSHWDRALPLTGAAHLPALMGAWTLLHLGTLWLNAVADRDEGPVLFGHSAPPPPGLGAAGIIALLMAPVVAWPAGPIVVSCALSCVVLAVGYSAPGVMWKGHPVGGPLVNGLGYGVLSPLAGWGLCGTPMTPRLGLLLVLVSLAVLGTYFAAQVFQADEDRQRGYRTLVATHGPARTVDAVTVCLMLSLGGLLFLSAAGWLPRALLLGVPMVLWVWRWLETWRATRDGGGEGNVRELLRRLVWSGLVFVCLALIVYAGDSARGQAVAGMATARGHPPDLAP